MMLLGSKPGSLCLPAGRTYFLVRGIVGAAAGRKVELRGVSVTPLYLDHTEDSADGKKQEIKWGMKVIMTLFPFTAAYLSPCFSLPLTHTSDERVC